MQRVRRTRQGVAQSRLAFLKADPQHLRASPRMVAKGTVAPCSAPLRSGAYPIERGREHVNPKETNTMSEYCGVAEAARILAVSEKSVYRWCAAGLLPAKRLGRRTWRIKRSALV